MIDYREFRPSAALSAAIECYWEMTGEPGAEAPIERILPDGCVEMVLHRDDPFRTYGEDGTSRPQPRSLVVGPATRFLLIQPPARVGTFGIRFRPGGAPLLLEMPLSELAERSAPLEALLGAAGRRLADRIGEATGADRKVKVAEMAMLERLGRRRASRHGAPIRPMVSALLGARGRMPVASVARQAGLSMRQIERRFLDEVGLGAKALARLARFQSAIGRASRERPIAWADLAYDGGYSDQAHLIREFREFSGETPRTLARSQGPLSRRFTSPERLRAFFAAG